MKSQEKYNAKGIHLPILFIRVREIIILFFRKFFVRVEMQNNVGGFTLVETLIVVALSLIIIVVSTPLYGAFFTNSQIDERTDELIQTVRLARERAVARVDDLPQGVHLVINAAGADEYVLYEGASYVPNPSERRIKLEDSLTLSTTIVGADINFSRGVGVPSSTGFITITQNGGVTRIIQVNQYGAVQKE